MNVRRIPISRQQHNTPEMGGNNTPGGTGGREEIMTVIQLSSAPNTFPTVISSRVLGAVFQETLIKQQHTTGLYLTFRCHVNVLCETVSGGLLIWEIHTEPAVCFLVLTRWFGTQLKGCLIGKSGDVGGCMSRFGAASS